MSPLSFDIAEPGSAVCFQKNNRYIRDFYRNFGALMMSALSFEFCISACGILTSLGFLISSKAMAAKVLECGYLSLIGRSTECVALNMAGHVECVSRRGRTFACCQLRAANCVPPIACRRLRAGTIACRPIACQRIFFARETLILKQKTSPTATKRIE
jgi:hypothetical protein